MRHKRELGQDGKYSPVVRGLGFRIERMALPSHRSQHSLWFEVGDHEEATKEGADNFTGGEQKKV